MSDCAHMDFKAFVDVHRLVDGKDTGTVTGYTADVRIECADCGKPFQFLGLEPGVDTAGARASIDGLEAHLAICPHDERPNPLQRMAFNIRKFDG